MRHGRPEMDLDMLKKTKMSSEAVGNIVVEYEDVSLATDSFPTSAALNIASQCNASVSSDLTRAIESSQRLNVGDDHATMSIFQESTMPYFEWKKPNLPFFTWALTYRLLWLLGFAKNGESIRIAKQRARECADYIESRSAECGTLLVVGHGIINRLIMTELKKRKWTLSESNGDDYWSYRVMSTDLSAS